MERVEFPALTLASARVTRGPGSIGSTEALTGKVQVVREPRGLWEWRFDYHPMKGRDIAEFQGFANAMEDGANWCAVSGFVPASPDFVDLGAPAIEGWAEGGWEEGGNWQPSFPDARVALPAAAGDHEVSIDVSSWNGAIWRGFDIGFYPYRPGLHRVRAVLSVVGDVARCRIWTPLEQALTTDHYVTLHPVMFMAMVPGTLGDGARRRGFLEEATVTMRQVLYADVAGTD
jgi:hypothetical protein